ncbi:hypothetical protein [Actinomadura latina]|uniref:Uncharacterized protein n=1 Tax=Actinomadura latina TaxID=163603 RepID=A0A846YW11_9ACTN|nr:hypothetical protein [Actinomadura latina]NKZ04271.1 hypothetical protein [Actinomadura latina]
MAWELHIFTLDVGHGDAALIVASNPATTEARTMLIDGGDIDRAEYVHTFVRAVLNQLGDIPLDHILVSNYKTEHRSGIVKLLQADNLFRLADEIAAAAVREAANTIGNTSRAARAAVGAYGACLGGYDTPALGDVIAQITRMANGAQADLNVFDDQSGAVFGRDYAVAHMPQVSPINRPLIGARSASAIAVEIGLLASRTLVLLGAGATVPDAQVRTATRVALRQEIIETLLARLQATGEPRGRYVAEGTRFNTEGFYNSTHLIEVGPQETLGADVVANATAGQLMVDGDYAQVPGLGRTHTQTPALGAEILWNSGSRAMLAPVGAPTVFVVAAKGNVWQGNDNPPVPVPDTASLGSDAIGVVVRFNRFLHYSASDLPPGASALIAGAVRAHGLANPGGGEFPAADQVTSFKCSGHGGDRTVLDDFLESARPLIAFISCGQGVAVPELPTQSTITRLHESTSISRFFLTNCRYHREHVRQSPGPQAKNDPVDKSRVAGSNGRRPVVAGNIQLTVTEGASNRQGKILIQYHGDKGLPVVGEYPHRQPM